MIHLVALSMSLGACHVGHRSQEYARNVSYNPGVAQAVEYLGATWWMPDGPNCVQDKGPWGSFPMKTRLLDDAPTDFVLLFSSACDAEWASDVGRIDRVGNVGGPVEWWAPRNATCAYDPARQQEPACTHTRFGT